MNTADVLADFLSKLMGKTLAVCLRELTGAPATLPEPAEEGEFKTVDATPRTGYGSSEFDSLCREAQTGNGCGAAVSEDGSTRVQLAAPPQEYRGWYIVEPQGDMTDYHVMTPTMYVLTKVNTRANAEAYIDARIEEALQKEGKQQDAPAAANTGPTTENRIFPASANGDGG